MRPRIEASNPWWYDGKPPVEVQAKHRRALFPAFAEQIFSAADVRTPLLLGPLRVGKTFLLRQIIGEAIASGRFKPKNICFAPIDKLLIRNKHCLYDVLALFREQAEVKGPYLVIYDEIQLCAEAAKQLKALIELHPDVKFVASSSAAYDTRLREQGIKRERFATYYLPPILFCEYLGFIDKLPAAFRAATKLADILSIRLSPAAIAKLNRHLKDYLNHGGYPGMVLAKSTRGEPVDITFFDKRILMLLTALYGSKFDASDLANLQGYLTMHSGLEVNVSRLATDINVKKPKIPDFIDYLMTAFVVARIPKVDEVLYGNCNHRRDRYALVNNSALSLSLGVELDIAEPGTGARLETFVRSQMHVEKPGDRICYIHFKENNKTFEIDLVHIAPNDKPKSLTEVKWSDGDDEFLAADRIMAYVLNKKVWRKNIGRPDILVCTSQSVYADKLDFKSGMTVVPTAQYGYALGLETIRATSTVEPPG